MAGIYVHIPFCKKRCIYCDFYSTTCMEVEKPYIEALVNEITLRADYLKVNGELPLIETIYIGGGTPTTLETLSLARILDTIYCTYPVASDAEVTIECNPDDLSGKKIQELRHLPINRLSIGIQTFSDPHLHLLNRRHDSQQAIHAVKTCQDAGFDNISIDLIYGLPKQSLDDWASNLNIATELNVQHISAYSLIYEEGTRLYEMRQQGQAEEASEQMSLTMFNTLIDHLALPALNITKFPTSPASVTALVITLPIGKAYPIWDVGLRHIRMTVRTDNGIARIYTTISKM